MKPFRTDTKFMLLALLAGLSATTLVSAQSQDQRFVVIQNVDAITDQPEVGGHVAIPLLPQSMAELDSDGNLVVKCDLDDGKCPNVGTGGAAGNLPAAPSFTFGLDQSGTVDATGRKLVWSGVSGAQVCYGLSYTKDPANAPDAPGWKKPYTASNGSYSLDGLFNLLDPEEEYSYDFTMRCYSTPDVTVDGTTLVAVQDKTTTVQLEKDEGGGGTEPAGSCQSYLSNMTQEEREYYDMYSAEKRGFNVTASDFELYTGDKLGVTQNGSSMPTTKALPGALPNYQTGYRSLSFTMPLAGGQNTGKFFMSVLPAQNGPTAHAVAFTISPCQGDFRPQNNASTDGYLHNSCRNTYLDAFNIRGNTSPTAPSFDCKIPAGQIMYINTAVRNMYIPGVPPTISCTGTYGCGVQYELSN